MQKTRWESIKSMQKNHLPKSTYVYAPWDKTEQSSFREVTRTKEKETTDPQKVPIGPNHLLKRNINKQCNIKKTGVKEKINVSIDNLR